MLQVGRSLENMQDNSLSRMAIFSVTCPNFSAACTESNFRHSRKPEISGHVDSEYSGSHTAR